MMPRKKSHLVKTRKFVLGVLPIVLAVVVLSFFFSSRYRQLLGRAGVARLLTPNWEAAESAFTQHEPVYGRQYAYYQLHENENLATLSAHFGVPQDKLAALNPGTVTLGTTVKVPPVEKPLQATSGPNGRLTTAKVSEQNGVIKIKNDFKFDKIVTTIPELARFLAPYNAVTQVSPKSYLINRPISLEENIRLDITNQTVDQLWLRSSPNYDITSLSVSDAEVLIKDTAISSYDPVTKLPDYTFQDGRSFILAHKSSRMDIINSSISYLGTELLASSKLPIPNIGGVYGVSWRIPDDRLGKDVVTGWVENSTFYKNHYGAYTFGASGMVWRGDQFKENDVYGLDPHDDSNNALVENNVFVHNGKHGFIVSKRCNYNIIRHNVSYSNGLHGFMIHQDSSYNIIEDNLAYDNVDNFVIFASDYNSIHHNQSYNARGSHVRINSNAKNTYVTNNTFYGGKRGVYLYDKVSNVMIKDNNIQYVGNILTSNGAQSVLLTENTIAELGFKIAGNDRLIFGPNDVRKVTAAVPTEVGRIWSGQPDNEQPTDVL